jgi:hypothetical protein
LVWKMEPTRVTADSRPTPMDIEKLFGLEKGSRLRQQLTFVGQHIKGGPHAYTTRILYETSESIDYRLSPR